MPTKAVSLDNSAELTSLHEGGEITFEGTGYKVGDKVPLLLDNRRIAEEAIVAEIEDSIMVHIRLAEQKK